MSNNVKWKCDGCGYKCEIMLGMTRPKFCVYVKESPLVCWVEVKDSGQPVDKSCVKCTKSHINDSGAIDCMFECENFSNFTPRPEPKLNLEHIIEQIKDGLDWCVSEFVDKQQQIDKLKAQLDAITPTCIGCGFLNNHTKNCEHPNPGKGEIFCKTNSNDKRYYYTSSYSENEIKHLKKRLKKLEDIHKLGVLCGSIKGKIDKLEGGGK